MDHFPGRHRKPGIRARPERVSALCEDERVDLNKPSLCHHGNKISYERQTALMWACSHDRPNEARELLKNGANPFIIYSETDDSEEYERGGSEEYDACELALETELLAPDNEK